jgi:hypothetical protein
LFDQLLDKRLTRFQLPNALRLGQCLQFGYGATSGVNGRCRFSGAEMTVEYQEELHFLALTYQTQRSRK